jgi:hypothetical protein
LQPSAARAVRIPNIYERTYKFTYRGECQFFCTCLRSSTPSGFCGLYKTDCFSYGEYIAYAGTERWTCRFVFKARGFPHSAAVIRMINRVPKGT